MDGVRYRYERPVDAGAADELRKALAFHYGDVTVRQLDKGIDVVVAAGPSEPELAEMVRHFLRGHRDVPATIVAEHPGRPGLSCGLPDDHRIAVARGAYLHGPEWTAAMDHVRELCRERLAEPFGAPLLAGSAQISRDVLVRAGYYKKFPNLVNAVARIRDHYWDGVTVSQLRPQQTEALDSFYRPAETVLTPVTCYHVYANAAELKNRYGTGLFAIDGPVFRHESHNHSATRLGEFRMFELIRMGSAEEVADDFERMMKAFTAFFAELGVPHRIISASDAFFGDAPTMTREAQLLNKSKFEVRVPLGDGELSVASVNSHGEVFADSFGLRDLGAEATCCAGIGLDRLTYALLSYGLLGTPA
ncbi:hypothetical protein OG895_30765 [Streptomyces sp. NBC_00201]|uniref:aminoacyl--tRNA ligase-related protein n=1 Tax=unclassified Streptomyces TaxID=2593676 RepID=UPI00225BAD37|nr:aminoacyl--tRNA ligase-related protein [Streptomyces sp. NBC_00201]MCX5249553.1 hypothetical protein [Streptomyces sp. NBC_00201]